MIRTKNSYKNIYDMSENKLNIKVNMNTEMHRTAFFFNSRTNLFLTFDMFLIPVYQTHIKRILIE